MLTRIARLRAGQVSTRSWRLPLDVGDCTTSESHILRFRITSGSLQAG